MDRVRLGRALGYGTRHAAKTVAAVVEAASAPHTAERSGYVGAQAEPTTARPAETRRVPSPDPPQARQAARPRAVGVAEVGHGLKHLKHLRRSVWQPLAVFSGALWLRVTGLFFGLIAFTIAAGAWRLHTHWLKGFGSPESTRFWLFLGVAGVFAYFAASSFVRANLRERRGTSRRRG